MRNDPSAQLGFIGEQMLTGRAIENSEARGQAELVDSKDLPTASSPECDAALIAAGVVFGKPKPNDSLFRSVTLPPGWRFEATDHAMWSHLVDDQGRKRAAVFYKAAFYDRRASMVVCARFSIRHDYQKTDGKTDYNTCRAEALDGDTVLFTTDWKTFSKERLPDGTMPAAAVVSDVARREATAWLTVVHPDWENPAAYWDVP